MMTRALVSGGASACRNALTNAVKLGANAHARCSESSVMLSSGSMLADTMNYSLRICIDAILRYTDYYPPNGHLGNVFRRRSKTADVCES